MQRLFVFKPIQVMYLEPDKFNFSDYIFSNIQQFLKTKKTNYMQQALIFINHPDFINSIVDIARLQKVIFQNPESISELLWFKITSKMAPESIAKLFTPSILHKLFTTSSEAVLVDGLNHLCLLVQTNKLSGQEFLNMLSVKNLKNQTISAFLLNEKPEQLFFLLHAIDFLVNKNSFTQEELEQLAKQIGSQYFMEKMQKLNNQDLFDIYFNLLEKIMPKEKLFSLIYKTEADINCIKNPVILKFVKENHHLGKHPDRKLFEPFASAVLSFAWLTHREEPQESKSDQALPSLNKCSR